MYEALKFALSLNSPVILRYAKGGSDVRGSGERFVCGKAVIRQHGESGSPVLWATGSEIATALKAAELLEMNGSWKCTVIEARFLKPFDREMAMAFSRDKQFTIEDHCLSGGLYSALSETLSEAGNAGVYGFGWSVEKVIGHGAVAQLKADAGLTAEQIAEKISQIMRKN
jgi:deoxyxylulose-5-phosphate synthase